MEKIAIIGTGLAGMSCGHFLHEKYDLTLYEEQDHIGGYTCPITVEDAGKRVFMDAGDLVFDRHNNPQLSALFDAIKFPLKKAALSFSVQYLPEHLEYRGPGLNHLFVQRGNLFKPSFIKLARELGRFNKNSAALLNQPEYEDYSIARYWKEFGYSEELLWKFLLPVSSGLLTVPLAQISDFPIVPILKYFHSLGFSGQDDRFQGHTPIQGNQSWQELLTHPFKDKILLNKKAGKVERLEDGKVKILATDGTKGLYDRVIMACPADQAYKIIKHKRKDEERLLSAFRYQSGKIRIHTDATVMPKTKAAWASWNYRTEQKGDNSPSIATYWVNSRQQFSSQQDYFVSFHSASAIDEKKIIREIETGQLICDVPAMQAQTELHLLNQTGPVYYCGGYFKDGLEGALASAAELCKTF